MCGIAGVVGEILSPEARAIRVRQMNASIAHRGPDDEGLGEFGDVCLGMRRLSIIDVAGGHQPMPNEDHSVNLVLNGEIYNFRELRRELEGLGHVFRTRSDVEVVVHCYEQFGEEFLSRLRGMFALALWDSRQRCLTLAVDRLGIKPLYYATSPAGLTFCSELNGLLASGLVSETIDIQAMTEFFAVGFVPAPGTIYESVRKVEPGSVLRWSVDGESRLHQYWDLPPVERVAPGSLSEVRHEVRSLLRDAVRSHLVSDVPLGAFLSGGIDSSCVVALMSEVADRPVRTFTVALPGPEHDESAIARIVARYYSTDHHELVVEPASVDILPELAAHFGEPFADSSALPMYLVSKMAAQHVKVVLSGDGGDELFLGYTIFRGMQVSRLASVLPSAARTSCATGAKHVTALARRRFGDQADAFMKRVGDAMASPDIGYKSKSTPPGLDAASSLLSKPFRARCAEHDGYAALTRSLTRRGESRDFLDRYAYAQAKVGLSGDILVKVDRMSMANSLEVRVPFLDHALVEYASALPGRVRLPHWRLKGLLKDAMADVLPTEVLTHPKHGFTIPLAAWLRGDIYSFARDTLLSPEARDTGFYDVDAVERFLGVHRDNRANLGGGLWALLMFELWRRGRGVHA